MKLFGITFKKEYVLHHMMPEDKIWFFDEPVSKKGDLKVRQERIKNGNGQSFTTTRYTIEI